MEFLNKLALGIIEFFSGNIEAVFGLAVILAVSFFYIEWKFDI
jgi:hypothetical protein